MAFVEVVRIAKKNARPALRERTFRICRRVYVLDQCGKYAIISISPTSRN